ncbi:MAG: elongation factor G [Phycisphaeraceae bacterium]|nr:elongation factor G [Phycisphaeraceae bacterium]
MPIHKVADIRNVCLVGHSSTGKTTLTERLLFATGVTKRMGSVEEGNTVSDFTDEEKQHKHSLQPSFMHFPYEGHEITLIDTPGMADFSAQAIACFPAAETIAVVIDAAKGIENGTRRMMTAARDRKHPVLIIVNKIDHPEADLEMLVEQIRDTFGPECLPINLPLPGRADAVNVFEHDGTDDKGDAAEFSSVHEAHKRIVEQVIEVDEDLTVQYLEKGEGFDPDKLHAAFEKCLEEGHLVPICFCSARTGAGIDDLLHILSTLCPSPVEVHPCEFLKRESPDGPEVDYLPEPSDSGPVIAHVFKVSTDPFVGRLGVFRVYSGVVKAKQDLLLDDQKKPIRIGHMFRLQGKDHVEVDAVGPGQIAAIAKVDELKFNSVLHDSHEADSVHLRPLPLPKPMFGLAIELKNHADETKFSTAVHKLMAEDPSLVIERIAATKQTVMRGMGELHLRVVLEKLKHSFHVEVNTSQPKIAYKETVTTKGNGHHRHKKQTGGAGQFGEVYLTVEPLPQDHPTGFEFINDTVGGSIPRQFMPAIEKGIRRVLGDGAVAGYPLTGVCVRVYDGKYHAVDSKEIAFVTAGRWAFIDGVRNSRPAILEPFVKIEISAPSKYMGDLTSDVMGKRGRILSTDILSGDMMLIRAEAPLGEFQSYSNQLKSMTGGTGTFFMDYSHDERAPGHVEQEVIAAFKPHAEED